MYNPQKCMHARQSLEVIRHSLDQLHKKAPATERAPPTNAVGEGVDPEGNTLRKKNPSNGSRKRAHSLYGAGHHPSFLAGNHVDLETA